MPDVMFPPPPPSPPQTPPPPPNTPENKMKMAAVRAAEKAIRLKYIALFDRVIDDVEKILHDVLKKLKGEPIDDNASLRQRAQSMNKIVDYFKGLAANFEKDAAKILKNCGKTIEQRLKEIGVNATPEMQKLNKDLGEALASRRKALAGEEDDAAN